MYVGLETGLQLPEQTCHLGYVVVGEQRRRADIVGTHGVHILVEAFAGTRAAYDGGGVDVGVEHQMLGKRQQRQLQSHGQLSGAYSPLGTTNQRLAVILGYAIDQTVVIFLLVGDTVIGRQVDDTYIVARSIFGEP